MRDIPSIYENKKIKLLQEDNKGKCACTTNTFTNTFTLTT